MQLLFVVLWICHLVSAQSSVTLWQFSHGNLLGGQFTLPLEPLGTAADGLSTTYLYQVLNSAFIDETSDGVTKIVTAASATPRTIVASASGWVENFASPGHDMIACALVNSDEGNCIEVEATTTSIGPTVKATPEVLAVSTSAPLVSISPPPTGTLSMTPSPTQVPISNTAQSQDIPKKSSSVGAIVGGVIGGLAGISILLAFLLLWRRRRFRKLKEARDTYPFSDSGFRSHTSVRSEFGGSQISTAHPEDDHSMRAVVNQPAFGYSDSKDARIAHLTATRNFSRSEFGSDIQSSGQT